MPMVSIITPAHGAETTLSSTLESLIAQTHADWECVIIDDGSTDRTAEIADRFAARDTRFRVLRQEQSGVSAARNAGLAEAKGDWVVFLDSDDALASTHLEIMLDHTRTLPQADILHCGWRRLKDGAPWWQSHPAVKMDNPFAETARYCPFAIHAALLRRSRLAEIGGFDPEMTMCEDWDLWQRLARAGAEFAPVEGLMADVSVEAGSLSSNRVKHLDFGLKVIRRGHHSDPRIAYPVPALAQGITQAALGTACWYLATWLVGATIGQGDNPGELLDRVAEPIPPDADAYALSAIMMDGIVVGAFPGEPIWPGLWSKIQDKLPDLEAWFNRHSPQEAFGSLLVRALERKIADQLPTDVPATIGTTRIQPIDLDRPIVDLILPGIERLRCCIWRGPTLLGQLEFVVFGAIEADAIRNRLRMMFGLEFDDPTDPTAVAEDGFVNLPDQDDGRVAAASMAAPSHRGVAQRVLKLMAKISYWAEAKTVAGWGSKEEPAPTPVDSILGVAHAGRAEFDRIVEEESQRAVAASAQMLKETPSKKTGPAGDEVPRYDTEAYWEELFSQVDPWDYRNNYETVKYLQTLSVLDDRRFSNGLELACAEGTFTRMLASRVDNLLATDISASAVARAASLQDDDSAVAYRQLDLLRDELEGPYDLIVCSEVLYYFENREKLRQIVDKIAGSLRPGGWFVTAHANLLVDMPNETGFGWPHEFGAVGIGEMFDQHPDLTLSVEARSPLYRIQRFEKVEHGGFLEPTRVEVNTAQPLPLQVASQVRWRGGQVVEAAADWNDVPILMYHQVSDDGAEQLARYRQSPEAFEAQLAFLRDAGWRAMTLDRLLACFDEGAKPPEKTLVLTFDDATRDFMTHALPLLHRYGFPSSLFVPTGRVGGSAIWDSAYGSPAPLLTWEELAAVAKSDVTLGAHGVRHVRLSALAPESLLRELAGSKAMLEKCLGREVLAIAYPYGDFDPAIRDIAEQCGYRIGLSCVGGAVRADADKLALKRQEVFRGITQSEFANLLFG
ncbi:trifunctional glycosyltransferase/class I SAM-dependent methyltransferase/polysaccharide deacetylase [Rhizobium leguminosarum]|uniref:Chitooligosaccharide deacetylase n=1 Tax=Rhizobium leguminosarum TaxID=384 RepID=A0A7X0DVQ4_RHILE|nr:trifunctional glycosyltransferase/class I SAM-dependent methyltransferase/polysaccharide deacetylase [Rhizobium leguminosarum]MBB6224968.1 peptidoglycan/xylan/chitin deacetylase (PgdA/CDA1 family)/SAM-dependent methyltransferase [Rhizobium leguminosarum]